MAADTTQVRGATTLDLVKLVAVTLMVVDHVGLYLDPENTWLRVLGRPAAVIFGFLIGFSASSRVPASWIALGLGLTLFEDWLSPDDDGRALDILIALALTRIAVPLLDRLHAASPLLLAPLAIAFALLAEPLNRHLEYGAEVPLMALLGVAVRLYRGGPADAATRNGVALIAIVGMSLISIQHFELEGWEVAACTAALALTICVLSRLKRVAIGAPDALTPLLRFVGRNTLLIYAVHLVALLIVWAWITADDDAAEE